MVVALLGRGKRSYVIDAEAIVCDDRAVAAFGGLRTRVAVFGFSRKESRLAEAGAEGARQGR